MNDSIEMEAPTVEAAETSTARPVTPGRKSARRGDDDFYVAVLFIIIIVLAIMSPDVAKAMIMVGGLLATYALISVSWHPPRGRGPAPRQERTREGFYIPPPGAPPPYAVSAGVLRREGSVPPYRGAIDFDEYESRAWYGHRDRTEGDNANAPDGNPYNTSRIGAPEAAGSCIDDEANDDNMDGDERMNYQGLARNDATRVEAGVFNRKRFLQPYLTEEVESAEQREWWGRHEV